MRTKNTISIILLLIIPGLQFIKASGKPTQESGPRKDAVMSQEMKDSINSGNTGSNSGSSAGSGCNIS